MTFAVLDLFTDILCCIMHLQLQEPAGAASIASCLAIGSTEHVRSYTLVDGTDQQA